MALLMLRYYFIHLDFFFLNMAIRVESSTGRSRRHVIRFLTSKKKVLRKQPQFLKFFVKFNGSYQQLFSSKCYN